MEEVFQMIPASGKVVWILGPLVLLFLSLAILFVYIAHSSQNVQFYVTQEGLRIRGDIYGRTVPAKSLISAQAKQIDLRTEELLQPRWRTNGIGLPGYRSGWFRLRNGEKALLFVTDPARVVYVPTREGYSLLLSVDRPDSFLQSISNISN